MRYFFLLFLFLFHASLSAQVNTESFRKDTEQDSFEIITASDISYERGNVQTLRAKQTIRLNYDKDDFYTFLMSSFERGVQDNDRYLNRGFSHYRLVYHVSELFVPESFVQYEFDQFLLMNNRFLFGFGNRFNFIKSTEENESRLLSLGLGLMYEYEDINAAIPQQTKILRSTNYLTARTKITDYMNFTSTVYFQINLADANDYRVLGEGNLNIKVTEHLTIATNINYRYDNDPPVELYPLDARISNSFIITF